MVRGVYQTYVTCVTPSGGHDIFWGGWGRHRKSVMVLVGCCMAVIDHHDSADRVGHAGVTSGYQK